MLGDVFKAINYIKASALNSRLLSVLQRCRSKMPFLHTEIKWLSRGKSLARVSIAECSKKISRRKRIVYGSIFQRQCMIVQLAYLCDIFGVLYDLNLSLQGRLKTVFKLASKIPALKSKTEMWLMYENEEY